MNTHKFRILIIIFTLFTTYLFGQEVIFVIDMARYIIYRGHHKSALDLLDKAIKELKIAHRLEPNNTMSLMLSGIAYKRKGSINNALTYFKKGITANSR